MTYTTRTTCRVCGSANLTPLFSLGEQFVSDFVDADKVTAGVKCPIDIELCNDCTFVQQKHTAPQDFMYSRHYWYRSGTTATMRAALRDVTAAAERCVKLQAGDVVLDIGSNDGTLLRSYSVPWLVRVGCEPADNMRTYYKGTGEPFLIPEFWSAKVYDEYLTHGKKAKVITACGMFYDLPDPNPFIADVAKVLAPDGVFIAQLMCLKQTLDMGDVGNFAHEHLEFYSLRSLWRLLNSHGLRPIKVEENDVNGGSYRIYAMKAESDLSLVDTTSLGEALDGECNITNPSTYADFFNRMEMNRNTCIYYIKSAVGCGKRVWVYGASTKGNVILQYYGLDHRLIEAAADKSPEKHGKYTVGTGIPIVSEDEFRKAKPDFALVLPYAFREEFLQRESEWRSNGGKFIFPLPQFEVV